MSAAAIIFLFGVYGGPLLGAVAGVATVGRRAKGLQAAIGGGIAVALTIALIGLFNRYILYSGPFLGALAAFCIVRALSK